MTAFKLHVPDADIADLRERLARARWPDAAPGDPWAYGTSVAYLRELVAYWRDGFDWRAQEGKLNAYPQFKIAKPDIDLHWLHVPGKGPNPTPLLLMHGWPGSVFEFVDFIPRLTDPAAFGGDPADAFTVVAPSLPGYGLSFRPGQARYGVEEIAACMGALMTDLGYTRFGVQGGDWGGITAAHMAAVMPERLIGAHVNLLAVPRDAKAATDPRYGDFHGKLKHWLDEETGYQWIQGTKPQTLSFGLTDSPVGLAAWIVEKFRAWTDCGGEVESALTRDQMLADISFYWFTGAIGSSFYPITSASGAAGQSRRKSLPPRPSATPNSPAKWFGRRALSLNPAFPTCAAGRFSRKADISRRWSSPRRWLATFRRFSGNCEANDRSEGNLCRLSAI